MAVSIQNPLISFNARLIKKSKFLMVRTLAMQMSKNVTKSEEKAKQLVKTFQSDIHSGSTGGINVRI